MRATVEFTGFNLLGGNQTNTATMFVSLDEYDKRHDADLGATAILGKLRQRLQREVPEAFALAFPPPPVSGIGNAGGYKLMVEDRGGGSLEELQRTVGQVAAKANESPDLVGNLSTFRAGVPQLFLEIDRTKAKKMDVPLQNVFDTLQTYLGSSYVNDFNLFGRTYRVTAQADAKFRVEPEDIPASRRATTTARWSPSAP